MHIRTQYIWSEAQVLIKLSEKCEFITSYISIWRVNIIRELNLVFIGINLTRAATQGLVTSVKTKTIGPKWSHLH